MSGHRVCCVVGHMGLGPAVSWWGKGPPEYSTPPGAADLQAMMWASSLAGAFASSFTFRKTTSRTGLKEGVLPSEPYHLECAHTGERVTSVGFKLGRSPPSPPLRGDSRSGQAFLHSRSWRFLKPWVQRGGERPEWDRPGVELPVAFSGSLCSSWDQSFSL